MGRIREWVARQEVRVNRGQADFAEGGARQVLKGLFMEKWLCWGSMGVAGLLLLLFLLDLVMGIPFSGINWLVDIFGIIASGIVGYLAWDALKDLR